MTLADDVVLIAHAGGVRPAAPPAVLDLVIAAAALTELRSSGRLRTGRPRPDGWTAVDVADATPTGDTIRDTELESLAAGPPAVLVQVLARPRAWHTWLVTDLVDRGELEAEPHGRRRQTSWRTVDTTRAVGLMEGMVACLRARGETFDVAALTLLRLLGPTSVLPWAAPCEQTGLTPSAQRDLVARLVAEDAVSAAVAAVLAARARQAQQMTVFPMTTGA